MASEGPTREQILKALAVAKAAEGAAWKLAPSSLAKRTTIQVAEISNLASLFRAADLAKSPIWEGFAAAQKSAAAIAALGNATRLTDSPAKNLALAMQLPAVAAMNNSAVSKMIEASRMAAAVATQAGLNETIASLIKSASFYDQIAKQTRIGLPEDYLAHLRAADVVSRNVRGLGGMRFLYSDILQRGFQTVAVLSLEGAVPTGVASDVLQHYSEAASAAPIFANAVLSANLMDIVEGGVDQVSELIEKAKSLLSAVITNEREVVYRGGLIGILMFIMALLSLYISWHQTEYPDVSKEAFENQTSEIHALGEKLDAIKAGEEIRQKEIRYVHTRSPLRSAPDSHAERLRYIFPDQILRVVGEKDGWAKVEAFDYQSDRPIVGWIYRNNLRAMPAQ